MRILLCAKNDLPALIAANGLADALSAHDVSIWLSDITRPVERDRPNLDLMRFFERELPLRWLLPTVETAAALPGQFLSFPRLADRLGASLRTVPQLRTVLSDFQAIAPDLVISIRFSHIFPAEFIAVPTHGILNVHPGYLPEFAGLYTPYHQIALGRGRIGCTLHWVDEGIDTGPIVDISSIAFDPDRSLQWHVAQTYPAALPALVHAIEALEAGDPVRSTVQDMSTREYYRMPSQSDLVEFQRHCRLVSPRDFAELMAQFGVSPDRMLSAVEVGAPQAAAG